MIEFKNVYIKYIPAFYSLYNFNNCFNSNTLIIGDAVNGSKAIFRILAKIDKFYSGGVFVDNLNLREIKDSDLNIAYLPEKFELFKLKSVEKNLIYPLKIRKINKKIAKIHVFNLLKQYNLEKFKKIKAFKLNQSEQKIVCLLRAITRKPKVILIENFFKNLDEKYHDLAYKIISDSTKFCTIIACEEDDKNLACYKNFTRLKLEKSDD